MKATAERIDRAMEGFADKIGKAARSEIERRLQDRVDRHIDPRQCQTYRIILDTRSGAAWLDDDRRYPVGRHGHTFVTDIAAPNARRALRIAQELEEYDLW